MEPPPTAMKTAASTASTAAAQCRSGAQCDGYAQRESGALQHGLPPSVRTRTPSTHPGVGERAGWTNTALRPAPATAVGEAPDAERRRLPRTRPHPTAPH